MVTPDRYLHLAFDQWDEIGVYVPYFFILPDITISICPFTGERHHQKLDTYSLYGWHNRYSKGEVVSFSPDGYHHSPHLYEVHPFINFNGKHPNKRNLMTGGLTSDEPEVPYITPRLLADDINGYAVIHSITIMNIRGKHFKPMYSLYVISYYADNVEQTLNTLQKEWSQTYPDYRRMRVSDHWEITTPEHWHLEHWVNTGRLKWLDRDNTLSSDVASFPYNNIDGLRHGYKYDAKTKQFTIRPTELY